MHSSTRFLHAPTKPIPTQYASVRHEGNIITITLDVGSSEIARHRTQATEEILKAVGEMLTEYIGEETDAERSRRHQTTAPEEC